MGFGPYFTKIAMKPTKIGRIINLLTALHAETNCNADSLAQLFKTSRRTIYRDLKDLKAMGIPYCYDHAKKGYIMDRSFFLPPTDLTLQEALGLLLLVHKSAKNPQIPFRHSALLAALKIENNLPPGIRRSCNKTLDSISTKVCAHTPTGSLDAVFAQITKAITKRRVLQASYHSLFEGNIIHLELSPYHLMFNRRAWYVLGLSSLHKNVRTFKLRRFRNLQMLRKPFTRPDSFNIDNYLGRAWSMIPEGRVYNIKLRFSPMVAQNVAEVLWHSTQKVTRHKDGSATLEFRVDGLGEISWWVLGYGDQVQVLAPKALRERILIHAENIVRMYKI